MNTSPNKLVSTKGENIKQRSKTCTDWSELNIRLDKPLSNCRVNFEIVFNFNSTVSKTF